MAGGVWSSKRQKWDQGQQSPQSFHSIPWGPATILWLSRKIERLGLNTESLWHREWRKKDKRTWIESYVFVYLKGVFPFSFRDNKDTFKMATPLTLSHQSSACPPLLTMVHNQSSHEQTKSIWRSWMAVHKSGLPRNGCSLWIWFTSWSKA